MSTTTQPMMNPIPGYPNQYCFPVMQPSVPFSAQPTPQFVPVQLPPPHDTGALAWSQYAAQHTSQRVSSLESQTEKCVTDITSLSSRMASLESQVKTGQEASEVARKDLDLLQSRYTMLNREHEALKKRTESVAQVVKTVKGQQEKKSISALSIFFLLITLIALAAFVVLMMCQFGLLPGMAAAITGSALGVAMGVNTLPILSLVSGGLVLLSSWAFFFTKK